MGLQLRAQKLVRVIVPFPFFFFAARKVIKTDCIQLFKTNQIQNQKVNFFGYKSQGLLTLQEDPRAPEMEMAQEEGAQEEKKEALLEGKSQKVKWLFPFRFYSCEWRRGNANGSKRTGGAEMREIANLFLGKPVLAVWEVTKKCNQKCAGCSIPDNTVKNEMSIEEISAVFGKLRKFGIKKVFLQGGEPLAHPKIREIVLLLEEKGFSQSILTNGLLLNAELIRFFDQTGVSVNVSLDSLKKDVYAAIRGSDTLELVKRNISLLGKSRNKKAHNVHCTASKMNSGEVFEIKEKK